MTLISYRITFKDGSQIIAKGNSYREAMESTMVPIDQIRNCQEIIEDTRPCAREAAELRGATPPRAVPAEEAKLIYEQTLVECGT